MLQEIKNLPLLIHKKWLDHTAQVLVRRSNRKADDIVGYFHTARHSLHLNPHEAKQLHSLLGLWVIRQDPKVIENPQVWERAESYYQQSLNNSNYEMGFKEPFMAHLIYSPLDEIAQLFVTNYQTISIVGEDINHGSNDPYFKSEKVLEIQNIVNQTMEQSVRLVLEMRRLETAYHPLGSQLTFRRF